MGAETERNGLPRRSARHHVFPCFFFCLFSHSFLVVSIASCLTQQPFKLRHKTSTSYAFQSRSFPPSLLRSFIFLFIFLYLTSLVSLSRTTLTGKQLLPRGTRTHFHLSLPLCAYSLPIHSPASAPPRSPLRYKILLVDSAHVYKTVLLLIEEGIDHYIIILRLSLSLSLSLCILFILGDRSIELLSTRSRPIPHFSLFSRTLFWDDSPTSQPLSYLQ